MKNFVRFSTSILLTIGAVLVLSTLASAALTRISTYWTGSLNSSTVSTAFKTQPDGGAPALFAAGKGTYKDNNDVVVVSGNTAIEATCCWCLDPACDVDQVNAAFDGGVGSCFRFWSGVSMAFVEKPDYQAILQSAGVGGQTGICSLPVAGATPAAQSAFGGAGDTWMYPPCDANTDCTTTHGITGATCVSAATMSTDEDAGRTTYATLKANVGAYLVCEAASSNRRIDAMKQAKKEIK